MSDMILDLLEVLANNSLIRKVTSEDSSKLSAKVLDFDQLFLLYLEPVIQTDFAVFRN